MKTVLKRLFQAVRPVVDLGLAVVAIPAALILWLYRRVGSRQLPIATAMLRKIGVFPIRDHYYEPMFNDAHLSKPLDEPRMLPGIEFNVGSQLDLLQHDHFNALKRVCPYPEPGHQPGSFYFRVR